MPKFKHDGDEYPTKPDLGRWPCPGCVGSDGEPTGEIVTETWFEGHLHQLTRQTCTICWGRLWIDRAALAKWGERQR